MLRIDSYIRAIIHTEGEDFIRDISPGDPMFQYSRISLELGDGTVRTLHFSGADETGRRFVTVSGTRFVYSLSGWSAQRLFRTADDFERL